MTATNTQEPQESNQTLDRQAIGAALRGDWDEAISFNQQIIASNPGNTSALNRLGIAYLKTLDLAKAKKAFLKVLEIDQFNAIAKTNLKKTSPKYSQQQYATPLSNHTFSFIEESGKSKVIPLRNIGEPQITSNLFTGLEVNLKIAARKVKVTTISDQYIGCLPDDISFHLIKLLKGGNKYRAVIKSVDTNSIEVFLKELKRSKKFANTPSFSTTNIEDLDIGGGSQPSQPPLEIFDPVEEAGLS